MGIDHATTNRPTSTCCKAGRRFVFLSPVSTLFLIPLYFPWFSYCLCIFGFHPPFLIAVSTRILIDVSYLGKEYKSQSFRKVSYFHSMAIKKRPFGLLFHYAPASYFSLSPICSVAKHFCKHFAQGDTLIPSCNSFCVEDFLCSSMAKSTS